MSSDVHPASSVETAGSRRAIEQAARELFAERGFNEVTIRDIAARAKVSPALVMKTAGSKQALYQQTATIDPPALPDVPRSRLGAALVSEIIDRHRRGEIEHLGRALLLHLTSPEPEAIRVRFLAGYVDPLAEVLKGPDPRRQAELVVAALSGLVSMLRVYHSPAITDDLEAVRASYAPAVQLLIDEGQPVSPDR
ncbi:TetR/AcrR family transcriptional regulator [Nocardioides sp. AN3]